jgi:DNA-binding protein YbaB
LDGKKRVDAIHIEPDAIDMDDLEMLEDLLIAAFNDAYKQVEEYEEEILPEGMAGLGL